MSESESEKGLRVVIVNPREDKPAAAGGKKKRMAKKKTSRKKKSAPKKRSTTHRAPSRRPGRRRLRRRSNPGFGFSGKNLAFAAVGGAGAAGVDFATSLLPIGPAWVGGIEVGGGAALAALVDHPVAQAGGAVLMTMGAFKLIGALLAPKAATGTAGQKQPDAKPGLRPAAPAIKRPGMKGIEAVEAVEMDGVGDYDGVGEVGTVGDYDGVGELEDGYDGVGELEDGYEGVGDYEGVGELEAGGGDGGGALGEVGEYAYVPA